MTLPEEIIVKGQFTVLNDKGLHTRPCTEIARCATSFRSTIFLSYRSHKVNAKSILGILMLAAARGSKITVHAQGNDATEALNCLLELANNKFNTEY